MGAFSLQRKNPAQSLGDLMTHDVAEHVATRRRLPVDIHAGDNLLQRNEAGAAAFELDTTIDQDRGGIIRRGQRLQSPPAVPRTKAAVGNSQCVMSLASVPEMMSR